MNNQSADDYGEYGAKEKYNMFHAQKLVDNEDDKNTEMDKMTVGALSG